MRKEIRIFLISLIAVLLLILFPSKTQASTPFDSVVFDGEFYLSNNADLRAAFGNDYQSAYNHFMSYGIREGRQASLSFDVKYYLAYYSDLSNAFHGDYAEALSHFMIFGIKEGRKSSPYFDVKYYLSNNSDLQRAFKNDYEAAGNHFLIFGLREGRRGSKYFDVKYYLNSNPDLKNTFKTDYMRAYDHYRIFGIKEGRNPSEDVNIKCYLNSYVDLQREFKGNYEKAAEHYYLFGEREGRKATHTIIEMKAVSATCEKTGLTKGKKCETCGEIMEKQNEVPKTKHTVGEVVYVWNETTSAKAIFNCKVCKQDIEAEVKITSEVTKNPSCYEKGVKTYTATASYDGKVIGTNQKTEEIAATDQHSFGDWKLDKDGKLERQCKTTGCTQKETKQVEETKVKIEKPVSTPDLDDWGYDHNHVEGKGYELTNEDNKNGKLSGVIAEQTINEDVYGEDKATGYYFAITVDLENAKVDHLSSDVKFVPTVKMVNGTVDKVVTLENEDDTLTILFRIDNDKTKNDDCSNECACKGEGKVADCKCDKKIVLTIDLDGEKGAYSETTYTIDYCNVTFEKDSKFEIKKELPESAKEAIKGQFNTWGFNPESVKDFEKYSTGLKIESVENDPHTVKVNGLLPLMKLTADGAFGKEATEKEGYYFVYVIKTEKSVGKNSPSTGEVYQSVEVKVPENGELEPTKVLNKDSFDTDNELAILMKVDPNNQNKKFKVIVDMDGDGKSCAPYEVTVDYSELEFQFRSIYTDNEIANNTDKSETDEQHNGYIPETDKETIEGWGYDFENAGDNLNIQLDNGKETLTGSVKEQNVSNAGFKDPSGYYVVLKVYGPSESELEGATHYQKGKWTVKFHNEDGEYKAPISPDNGEDFVVALIKLKDDGDKKIKYEIDWDGDGNYYLPFEETIDYSSLKFLSSHKVTFKDGETSKETTVWDGEKITIPEDLTTPKADDPYHEFAYWNKENGINADTLVFANKKDSDAEGKETGDVTLVPHWNLYSDKFISDVIDDLNLPKGKEEGSQSENFSDKFVLKKDGGNITIKVLDAETTLDEMNNTSIPGAIAYILLKDEIKEISLSIGDGTENKTSFTKGDKTSQADLKSAVQASAKELYKNILTENFDDGTDETVTLTKLAGNETYNNFTLTFDTTNMPKTITLAKTPENSEISLMSEELVPTSYKFTFDSDIIIVDDETSLKLALEQTDKEIYISKPFTVNSPIKISQKAIIHGNGHTITVEGESKNTVFVVNTGNVNIDNLGLAGSTEAGIEVQSGSLTATSLTYAGENYNNPVVRSNKSGATVDLSGAIKLDRKEKITKYENRQEETQITGDLKELDAQYSYINYYNQTEHSKIYETKLSNHQGGYRLEFVRYNYYDEKIELPSKGTYTVLSGFKYEGEDYTAVGFTKNGNLVLVDSDETEGVTKLGELKATEDEKYWVAYTVKLEDGTRIATTADELSNYLQESSVNKIIISPKDGNRIELTSDITLNRSMIIIGKTKDVTLKTQGINVTADKVGMQRLILEVDAKENRESLIDVKITESGHDDGVCKFSLWQSTLKNVSSTNSVKNAINYNVSKVAADVRWCIFDSNKITENYINIDGALAEGTEMYLNTFGTKTTDSESKLNAIAIKEFDETAKTEEGETDVRIASNDLYGTGYMVKISKNANNDTADIDFNYNKGTSEVATIAVECTTNENFSNIKFLVKDFKKAKAVYLKDSQVLDTPPAGVQGVKIVAEMAVVPQK